jgi:hypothetical protein
LLAIVSIECNASAAPEEEEDDEADDVVDVVTDFPSPVLCSVDKETIVSFPVFDITDSLGTIGIAPAPPDDDKEEEDEFEFDELDFSGLSNLPLPIDLNFPNIFFTNTRMGQGQSLNNPNSGGGINKKSNRVSRLPTLLRSGRYIELTSPSSPNTKIHVIGVFPCSTLSAEEAEDLINEVKPDLVYMSLHPEIVSVLEKDVKANKFIDAGWKIPENSPTFERYDGAGWLVSLNIRNVLADNEMLGLLGAEAFLPYKTALRAIHSLTVPPKILSFPLTMQYNNGETLDQPAHFNTMLVGNASTGSMQVTALVGNPNSWFFLDQVLQDQQAAEAAVKAGTSSSSTSSTFSNNPMKPDVEFSATIPESTGYFTRSGVLQLQHDFRTLVNTACIKSSSSSADVEADLLLREAAAREAGKPDIATTMGQRAMTSQRISQAAAFHIQESINKEVENDLEISQSEENSLLPTSTSSSSSSSSSSISKKSKRPLTAVAVVNIGQLASLSRNWNEARPPAELFPPLSTFQLVIGNAVPASAGFLTLYGLYRGFKRFPRITTAFTVTTGIATSAIVYSALNGDWTRYGSFVRSALARPRVVSPVMRVNR